VSKSSPFPECFLTGYPDTEELARKHAFAIDSAEILKLLDRTVCVRPTS
jgi:predicted amidohydrolase